MSISNAGRERLQILHDHLVRLGKLPKARRKRRFDLGVWRATCSINPCNTAACAVGEATMLPKLIAQGLGYQDGSPFYDGWYGWGATQAFFGLKQDEARSLFFSDSYPPNSGPTAVATRIRKFLESSHESQ